MAPSRSQSSHHASKQSSIPIPPRASENRQQTISQLFSSQQKPSPPDTSPLSPSNKRKRPASAAQHHQEPQTPPRHASTSNMYNFSSKSGATGNVIDLTASPTGTPRNKQRRISVGAKVENAPSPGGPKKLSVKNFRTTAKSDSSQYVAKTIAELESALDTIFTDQRPALSKEELYRGSENVCKLGEAPELAKKLNARCKAHVSGVLKAYVMDSSEQKNVQVLKAMLEAWAVWTKQLTTIRQIFFFLDRSYLIHSSVSIQETAIRLFRTHIFGDPALRGKVVDGACDLLLNDRKGAAPDTRLFAASVKMCHELQVYTSDFEPRMLAVSQAYIAEWSEKATEEKLLPDYVSSSFRLIDTEMERCQRFDMISTTRRSLLALLENHLIERRESYLTNANAVADELDKDTSKATQSMQALFALLERRRLGQKLKEPFAKWIDDTGTAIIFDEKVQEQMVVQLLEFKQKLDHIWRFAFLKDQELGHSLRNAFEEFMNKSKKSSATWNTDNSRTGEMIAKYVDTLLKSGAKAIPSSLKTTGGVRAPKAFKRIGDESEGGLDENASDMDEDTEVDNQLDQVLDLFRFVHGKAVFEAFYKKDLARRLLMDRSASHDAEKNMLARLKTECGAGFTHNLEQMFKDISLAAEEAKAYRDRHANDDERKSGIDLNVNVLSSAAWPTYPDTPVAIPPEIKRCVDDFERFYMGKHSGRKLSWKHALAHCQMKANFATGPKEIVVSSFQAIILLLFNGVKDDEKLSYEHIKAESGLSDADVQRTLQSLACAKLRPLTKHPRSRDVAPTDTFSLNNTFTHPKHRLKINQVQLKETKEENKETHVRVAADRQFETQAAIVRIMKGKKRLQHAQLVAEVISATKTRGVLQPAEIKREVDKLVEKEYLERVEGGAYAYLA